MDKKVFIKNEEGCKVILYTKFLNERANSEQKKNFLDHVMNLISEEYPGEPANYYEECHVDTLSVIVVLGINNL